jgi:hypothetical protein
MDQCSTGTTPHKRYRRPHQPAGARSTLRNRPMLQVLTVLTSRRLGNQRPARKRNPGQQHADRFPLGSHARRHFRSLLICGFGPCLTAMSVRFVSRNAAFPTAVASRTTCDQGFLSALARHDISSEKMSSAVRLYKRGCRFSKSASSSDAATCGDPRCLTGLHRGLSHGELHFLGLSLSIAMSGCQVTTRMGPATGFRRRW